MLKVIICVKKWLFTKSPWKFVPVYARNSLLSYRTGTQHESEHPLVLRVFLCSKACMHFSLFCWPLFFFFFSSRLIAQLWLSLCISAFPSLSWACGAATAVGWGLPWQYVCGRVTVCIPLWRQIMCECVSGVHGLCLSITLKASHLTGVSVKSGHLGLVLVWLIP